MAKGSKSIAFYQDRIRERTGQVPSPSKVRKGIQKAGQANPSVQDVIDGYSRISPKR